MGTDTSRDAGRVWLIRGILLLILVILLAIGYLLTVALVPRWWGQWIGNRVDGRITVGTGYGLVIGFLFTLLPLVIARQAFRPVSWGLRAGILVFAVLLAVPNLMTLGIVLGDGNAAHAGERILDVDGPGFRYASAFGAAAAALVFLAVVVWTIDKWRDRRVVARLKERDPA